MVRNLCIEWVGATIVLVFAIATMVLLSSCESQAMRVATARNPGCQVAPLEERADRVRVQVTCPGQAPVVRTYGR